MAININWGDSTNTGTTLNGTNYFYLSKTYSGNSTYSITLTGSDLTMIKELSLSGSNLISCPDFSDIRYDIVILNLDNNLLTTFPTVNSKLRNIYLNNNILSTSAILKLTSSNLEIIEMTENSLTGNIPAPSAYIIAYNMSVNSFTGYTQRGSNFSAYIQAFNDNNLSSTEVNKVLSDNQNYNISESGVIDLTGANMGAPNGQGITDKASLIARGFTIVSN
jgi:hypothetical protein